LAFTEQLIADTQVVIARLFDAMPQVDTINLCVFDRIADESLVKGTVSRSTWLEIRGLNLQSARMRLLQLGLHFLAPEPVGPERRHESCKQ
jgi:hypothetical protein